MDNTSKHIEFLEAELQKAVESLQVLATAHTDVITGTAWGGWLQSYAHEALIKHPRFDFMPYARRCGWCGVYEDTCHPKAACAEAGKQCKETWLPHQYCDAGHENYDNPKIMENET